MYVRCVATLPKYVAIALSSLPAGASGAGGCAARRLSTEAPAPGAGAASVTAQLASAAPRSKPWMRCMRSASQRLTRPNGLSPAPPRAAARSASQRISSRGEPTSRSPTLVVERAIWYRNTVRSVLPIAILLGACGDAAGPASAGSDSTGLQPQRCQALHDQIREAVATPGSCNTAADCEIIGG